MEEQEEMVAIPLREYQFLLSVLKEYEKKKVEISLEEYKHLLEMLGEYKKLALYVNMMTPAQEKEPQKEKRKIGF